MEFLTYKIAAKKVTAMISEPSMREFLFDSEEVSHHALKGADVLYSLIQTEFCILYQKWLRGNTVRLVREGGHAGKAFRLLSSVYWGNTRSLDAMIYVLTEAQRDVAEKGDASWFADMVAAANCDFGRIYMIVRNAMLGSEQAEARADVMLRSLEELIHACLALQQFSVARDQTSVVFRRGEVSYPADEYVYITPTGEKYFLCERQNYGTDIKNVYSEIHDGKFSKELLKKRLW